MSERLMGGICAIIAMVSVGIMVTIGTISGNWTNLWLIPFFGGILIAIFSIVAGAMKKSAGKKNDKK